MRRREFIVSTLGLAVARPYSARAQSTERLRIVGIISAFGSDDPEGQVRLATFKQALEQLGWEPSRNLKIEIRWIGRDEDRIHQAHQYAAEIVALAPDVILAIASSAAVDALQQQTRSIPIVFANIVDPVGLGFVKSMAHPGGNITGFSYYEYSMPGKWAELLKRIAPRITRALVLRDASASNIGQFAAIRTVAQSLGVELTPQDVRDTSVIERGLAEFASTGDGGVIVTAGSTSNRRKIIIDLIARYKLPAVYPYRYFPADGGLMSYGPNTHEPLRQA